MNAEELRAIVAQGPAIAQWPATELLRLMDERDLWRRAADDMATIALRGFQAGATRQSCADVFNRYCKALSASLELARVASAADAAPDRTTGLPPCNNSAGVSKGAGPFGGEDGK